jgi:quinol monooxygenase YgiN
MNQPCVFIEFTAAPGQRDALVQHLVAAAESYRSEAGTLAFTVHVSPMNADLVLVYEHYDSDAAKAAHESAPGYAAIRAGMGALLGGPPRVVPMMFCGGKQ